MVEKKEQRSGANALIGVKVGFCLPFEMPPWPHFSGYLVDKPCNFV